MLLPLTVLDAQLFSKQSKLLTNFSFFKDLACLTMGKTRKDWPFFVARICFLSLDLGKQRELFVLGCWGGSKDLAIFWWINKSYFLFLGD